MTQSVFSLVNDPITRLFPYPKPNTMAEQTIIASPAMSALDDGTAVTMNAEVPGTSDEIHKTPTDTKSLAKPEPPTENSTAQIRYRTEYRNSFTKALIQEDISNTPHTGLQAADHTQSIVFEVVKTYMFLPSRNNTVDNLRAVQNVTEPTYAITLYSPALVNALRSVIQYYPGQDLSGNITINAPYCILVHHYDDLQRYAKDRSEKSVETLCFRDRFVVEHMKTLIQFLEENIMADVRAEMDRNSRGYYTFAHAWVSHKPGRTMINQFRSQKAWKAGVIKSLSGGTFTSPPRAWDISYWSLKYDGRYLVRVESVTTIDPFDGESSMDRTCSKLFDSFEVENSVDPDVQDLISWGRLYCRLLKKQCMHHSGRNTKLPYQQVGWKERSS